MSGPDSPTGVVSECAVLHDWNNDGYVDLKDFTEFQKLPENIYADNPNSWLVLYNSNSPESIEWKDWYIEQWGINQENTLGLSVSLNERITLAEFNQTIYYPVQSYLINNPVLRRKVMGILVGYQVPGNFINGSDPVFPGGGGYSVSNWLINMSSNSLFMTTNFHLYAFYEEPIKPKPRLNKRTIGANLYITARIDAPSLSEAKELTIRAKKIRSGEITLAGSYIYYDYSDVGAPAGDVWQSLDKTVNTYPLVKDLSWTEWNSDTEVANNSAFEFSYYRISGWQSSNWNRTGPRVLGYAFNSWGATTVRSLTNHNGRFVPNLLFQGGYCSGIGATAEPYSNTGPSPHMIIWCLKENRTVAEALFHSQVRTKWMWEVIGDPLLCIPGEWHE